MQHRVRKGRISCSPGRDRGLPLPFPPKKCQKSRNTWKFTIFAFSTGSMKRASSIYRAHRLRNGRIRFPTPRTRFPFAGLISCNWTIFTSAPFNSVIYYAKISKSLNKPGTARGLVRCALSICVVYYCNDKISWRDTFVFCSNKHENFDVNFWLEPSKIQGRVEKPLALVANTLPVVVFFLVLVFVQVLFRVARTSPKCVWRKSISCTVYRWKIYISKYLWTICTNPDANTILNINACRDGALKKTLKKCERRTWK